MRQYQPTHLADYTRHADYVSSTWASGGEDFINSHIEMATRSGGNKRIFMAGSGALLGIHNAAKAGGNYQLQAGTAEYGIQVMKWITPFGVFPILLNSIFSQTPHLRNSMAFVDANDLTYRYVDDTFFKGDSWREGGSNGADALKEEYITECGLEWAHPEKMLFLNGIGQNGASV